jgi:hypothetical protein
MGKGTLFGYKDQSNGEFSSNERNVFPHVITDGRWHIHDPADAGLFLRVSLDGKKLEFASTPSAGTIGGAGTLNRVAKFTPDGVTIGDSSIYDDGLKVVVDIGVKVGIGTASPTTDLHVVGGFRYVDGFQAAGKILMSDAIGNATWQTAPSTGITSLNGLTGTTQTFSTGTSGVDFNISSLGTVHTFNIPTASSIHRGALSSTDWTTFNSKQDPISLTTTGTSGPATFIANILNIPNYTAPGIGAWSLVGNSGTTAGTNFIGTTDLQDLAFKTNSVEGMRLTTSGYLGIGTTTPSSIFNIVGTNPILRINGSPNASINLDGTTSQSFIRFSNSTVDAMYLASVAGAFNYLENHQLFKFKNGSNLTSTSIDPSTGMWAFQSPAAGIFTASALVHIQGSGATSATTAFKIQDSATSRVWEWKDDGKLYLNGNVGMYYDGISSLYLGEGFTYARINPATALISLTIQSQYLQSAFNTTNYIALNNGGLYYQASNAGSSGQVAHRFSVDSPLTLGRLFLVENAGTDYFSIRADGNVGINTGSAAARLHVVGSGNTSATNTALFQNASGNSFLQIRDNGSYSGTGDPTGTAAVTISNTDNSIILDVFRVQSYLHPDALTLRSFGSSYGLIYSLKTNWLFGNTGDEIVYAGDSGTKMRLIGVGTNTASSNTLWIQDAANTLMFTVRDDGNVGVGVNPTARLHVVGSGVTSSTYGFKLTDSAGNESIFARNDRHIGFGADALNSATHYFHNNEALNFGSYFGYSNINSGGVGVYYNITGSSNIYGSQIDVTQSSGNAVALQVTALSATGSTNIGAYGQARNGTVKSIGVLGEVPGGDSQASTQTFAVFASNVNTQSTDNKGYYANVSPTANSSTNYGIFLDMAPSGTTTTNYGVKVELNSTGVNYGLHISVLSGSSNYSIKTLNGKVNMYLQVGNGSLSSGDFYKDTAANIFLNGDYIVGMKA